MHALTGRVRTAVREFRRLFADALTDYRREPRLLHLVLVDAHGREEATRDLLRREQECCPFFSFSVTLVTGTIIVDAEVPEGADVCLDDLERLASRVLAGREA